MKQCTTHHHACDCREREFALVLAVANAAEVYRMISIEHPQIAGEAWRDLCKAIAAWKGEVWGDD